MEEVGFWAGWEDFCKWCHVGRGRPKCPVVTHMEPQLGMPGRHEGGLKSLGCVALLLGLGCILPTPPAPTLPPLLFRVSSIDSHLTAHIYLLYPEAAKEAEKHQVGLWRETL